MRQVKMSNRMLLPRVATAYATVVEQLRNRGFDVSNYEGSSLNEISAMLDAKQMSIIVGSPETGGVHVLFHVHKGLRPPQLLDFVEESYDRSASIGAGGELMIIAKDSPNDTLKNEIERLWVDDKKYVNVRGIETLQFNVIEHLLVPIHTIAPTGTIEILKTRLGIVRDNQFPEISRFDACAIAIGLRPNQIVQITRPSRTAVVGDYYRRCI